MRFTITQSTICPPWMVSFFCLCWSLYAAIGNAQNPVPESHKTNAQIAQDLGAFYMDAMWYDLAGFAIAEGSLLGASIVYGAVLLPAQKQTGGAQTDEELLQAALWPIVGTATQPAAWLLSSAVGVSIAHYYAYGAYVEQHKDEISEKQAKTIRQAAASTSILNAIGMSIWTGSAIVDLMDGGDTQIHNSQLVTAVGVAISAFGAPILTQSLASRAFVEQE